MSRSDTFVDAKCISYIFSISKGASSHSSGTGITSYLSSLGGTNSQLHGPGMSI